jgi:hypothetical protein
LQGSGRVFLIAYEQFQDLNGPFEALYYVRALLLDVESRKLSVSHVTSVEGILDDLADN